MNLLCKWCSNWLWPKTFLTVNGDNICCDCAQTKTLGKTYPNKPLDIWLDDVKYPCMNIECNYAGPKVKYTEHKKLCHFANIVCPFCEEIDLREDTFIAHLKKHKCSEIVESHTSSVPAWTLNLESTLNASIAIHIITINGNTLILMFRQLEDGTLDEMNVTVGQLYATEDILDYNFTLIYVTDRREIRISGDVFSMRKMFNQDQEAIPTRCLKFKKVKLYFANFEDITGLQECPVCLDYITSKLYSCENKHIICENCNLKIESCPLCREKINEHAIDLTKLKDLPVPCSNISKGCLIFASGQEHNRICMYTEHSCPEEECSYSNHKLKVLEHMRKEHKCFHIGYGFHLGRKQNRFEAYIDYGNELFKISVESISRMMRPSYGRGSPRRFPSRHNACDEYVKFTTELCLNNNRERAFRYEIQIYKSSEFREKILCIGNFCKAQMQMQRDVHTSVTVSTQFWPGSITKDGMKPEEVEHAYIPERQMISNNWMHQAHNRADWSKLREAYVEQWKRPADL